MTDGWTPARYNDGQVAATRSALVRFADGRLIVADDQGVAIDTWPAESVRAIEGPDAENRVVLSRWGQPGRLVVHDLAFAAGLRAQFPNLRRDPYASGISTRAIALSLVGALVSLAVVLRFLLPLFAAEAARLMPAALEERSGRWIAEAMIDLLSRQRGYPATCTAARGRAALDRMAAPLLAAATLKVPATIRVVRVPIVNAFALPGSQVVIFNQLIEKARSPNEVAGVLAHELAHAELRHPTEVAIKLTASSYLIGLVFGDVLGTGAVALAAQTLLGNAYTREAEAAADARAVELMQAAGYDARPLADFFDRLQSEGRPSGPARGTPPGWLSTHPPSNERARRIRETATGGRPALTEAGWVDLRDGCLDVER